MMNLHFSRLTRTFSRLKVVVLGDAILDAYLHATLRCDVRNGGSSNLTVSNRIDNPGGAANTAANVASLGGQVRLVTVIGDDAEGERLCEALRHQGVSTEHVIRCRSRRTLIKSRVMIDSQIVARCDAGAQTHLDPSLEQRLLTQFVDAISDCDAIIVSDYGYGVLMPRVIDTLGMVQRRTERTLVVDSRHQLGAFKDIGVTAVKPNYSEAVRIMRNGDVASFSSRAGVIAQHQERLLHLTGAHLAVVTLDADGALLLERGRLPYRTYARPRRAAYAIGAGDTFVSALTLTLASGAVPRIATAMASSAAAVVVKKEGTSVCSAFDLHQQVILDRQRPSYVGRLMQGCNDALLHASCCCFVDWMSNCAG